MGNDKKMSQQQIDDLISQLSSGEEDLTNDMDQEVGEVYTDYDFDRPDKFNMENLKSLQSIATSFARNFSQLMSASLKMPINFRMTNGIEQVPYATEFLEKLPKNYYVFCVVDLGNRSLGLGKIIVQFDLNMVLPIHRKMMGAKQVKIDQKIRNLTEIEKITLEQWVKDLMFPNLQESFRNVVDLKLKMQTIETDAQYIKVTTATDMIAIINFEVSIGEDKTMMQICIPYMSIEPIMQQLTTENIYEFKLETIEKKQDEIIQKHIMRMEEEIEIELGTSLVTVEELLALGEGDVLLLDKKIDENLIGYVSNKPKLSCTMGRKENKVAVKITGFIEKE